MYKVLVVDDSKFMRAMLKNLINHLDNFTVADEAENGKIAYELIKKNKYDVVTMDIEMPVMNGIQSLKKIISLPKHPPVVMFSSLSKEGAKETIEALTIGASGFLTKPQNPIELKRIEKLVENKLYEAINANKKVHSIIKKEKTTFVFSKKQNPDVKQIVLIGCSAGGPQTLKGIIPQIPKNTPAAFVIVQHMPSGDYIRSLADSLDRISEVQVKEAYHKETLKNGTVYIIPGGVQGKIQTDLSVVLTKGEAKSGHQPSVDVLFESGVPLADKIDITAIILTGMGSDGTNGAIALKKKKCTIISESPETAIVYGMPKKVFEAGIVDEQLNAENIIPTLIDKYIKK